MNEMYENLSKIETLIADYIQKANVVKMADIINYLNDKSFAFQAEFIQNIVRDLVHKDVLSMKQSPIDTDWTYELSYFYNNFKKSID
jgi:hypothetical protein